MLSPGVRPRTVLSAACCALLISVAATACGSGDSGRDNAASDGPCATSSTSGRDGVRLLPVAPATVAVTNPGGQPRAPLGVRPNIDSPQLVTLTTESTEARSGGRTDQTVTLPMTARIGCDDPTDVEMSLGAVSSPDPALNGALAAERDALAGMSLGPGTMPMSLRLIPPGDASSQARSAVEQALVQALQNSVPMPTAPVGPGATWTVVRTLTGAMTTTSTITATLRSRTGDTAVIDVSVDETPINDVFAIPGSTKTLTINRYAMSGTGSLTVDLARAFPTAGRIDMRGARELAGDGAPLTQQLGFAVSWSTRTH